MSDPTAPLPPGTVPGTPPADDAPAVPVAPPGTPDAGGAPPPGTAVFTHTGRVRELLAIGLVNLLLKVLTLGVYHFWAKTRVRRYVWSHTHYAQEAFEYTGRGLELALGYAIAMGVLVPLVLGLEFLPVLARDYPWVVAAGGMAAYPVFVFLTGFATFSSRRYLLSRTRWRSIRFALTGRARDHGWQMLLGSLLTAISFGLYLPFMRTKLTRHLVGNAWFGSERFVFDGQDDALLRRFLAAGGIMTGIVVLWGVAIAVALPLAIRLLRGVEGPDLLQFLPAVVAFGAVLLIFPSMALAWLWYRAGELRYWVAHTRLGGARFSLELPTRRYLWLYVGNVLALVLTLGLAYPWVVVRTARTLARYLRMTGHLDVAAIEQTAAQAPRTGEGLADALDLGSI